MEWKIEELLPPEAIEVLEQEEIHVNCVQEQDDQLYAEIEFYSQGGGDQIFTIWFDKPDEESSDDYPSFDSFLDGLYREYESFDVDEYVQLWLEAPKNSCPLNARQLVEDAEDVENTLDELYDKLMEVYKNL